MLPAMLLWGAIDNGRLGMFENMHIAYVKDVAKRTRRHPPSLRVRQALRSVVGRLLERILGAHLSQRGTTTTPHE